MEELNTMYLITQAPKNEDNPIPSIIGIFKSFINANYFLINLTGSENYESKEYNYEISSITTDF